MRLLFVAHRAKIHRAKAQVAHRYVGVWYNALLHGAIVSLEHALAAEEPDEYDNNREHEEDMDKPAQCITRDEPQEPQNNENNRYGPQHTFYISKRLMRPVSGSYTRLQSW